MTRLQLAFYVSQIGFCLNGQNNLVNNPSFEVMNSCPPVLGAISSATGWYANCNSPDYYNACDNVIGKTKGVPRNYLGFQSAATGTAYAGFIGFDPISHGEILGSELNETMVIGEKYYLSMKLSLAENRDFDFQEGSDTLRFVPSNKAGMKFSTTKITYSVSGSQPYFCTNLANNFAHLYSASIISDTANWTTVQGSMIADSAYRYIMIGNFFSKANIDTIGRPGTQYKYGSFSYFYVDDIIVSTDSSIIQSIAQKGKAEPSLIIYPNPSNGIVTIRISSEAEEKCVIELLNGFGNTLFQDQFKISEGILERELDLSDKQSGIYFLKFSAESGSQVVRKLFIDN